MARAGISYDDVNQAAEALLSAGQPIGAISIRMVREQLGTGSLTGISKYLAEWKQGRGAARPEQDVRISARLEKALLAEMQDLMQEGMDGYARTESALMDDVAQLTHENQILQLQLENLRADNERLVPKEAELKVALAELELLRHSQQEQQNQILELKQQLAAMPIEHEKAMLIQGAQSQAAVAENAVLKQQVKSLSAEVEQLRQEAQLAAKLKQQIEIQEVRHMAQLQTMQNQLDTSARDADRAQESIKELRTNYSQLWKLYSAQVENLNHGSRRSQASSGKTATTKLKKTSEANNG